MLRAWGLLPHEYGELPSAAKAFMVAEWKEREKERKKQAQQMQQAQSQASGGGVAGGMAGAGGGPPLT